MSSVLLTGTREALNTGSYTHLLSNKNIDLKEVVDLFLRSTQGDLSLAHY